MADDILKQFLISIGYREDEASKKRFMEGLKKAELAVAGLATGLTAMATAATVAALKVAGAFEGLSYVSQKAGASINNLKGLAYAVSQLGGSYQGALASVEAFAKQMRTNPGYEGLVRSLGVATRQNGKLRETTDILSDLGEVFRKQSYHIGYTYAQTLGIDEDTFRALRNNSDGLKRFKEEYEKTTRRVGLDSEDAARKSTALMQSLRSLQMSAEVVAQKLMTDFVPAIAAIIDKLRAWIEQNPDQIRVWIENAGKAAMALAAGFMKVVDAITPLVTGLGNITSSITGEKGLQGGLEVFATWLTTVWLVKILAAFTGVGAGWAAMLLRMGLNPAVLLGGAAALSGVAVATQLPKAVARGGADPATGGALDANPMGDVGKENQGSLGRWWRRTMPTWLGGDSPGKGMRARAERGAKADQTNYNFTGENADALRQAAKELGTSPEDLATVISYESKFRPNVWGGKGGNYMGLIQFGKSERDQFGANDKQSFKEQLPAVVRFLKSRGFKPGMGLLDLYSTISAGRPGLYDRSDGYGTVRSHAEKMQRTEAANVARFLGSTGAAPERRPIGQATNVSDAEVIANDHGHWNRLSAALGKMDFSRTHGAAEQPLGVSNTDNSSSKTLNMPQNITVNVQGAGSATDTAAATTRALTRFQEFSLRNAQGAVR
ncbi:hypothetical protein FF100_35555 [Methylobacterium terricola]|uniref:Uncharacterized protein n=1 Tax=Methylobacterium terricola TaxID=2583531 RepID=A0A5C4L821_9HYPH|nr:hypothetical protein [Methylobacterium terricola]TNC05522.1 hypothetical protein FF100_35555 [Methylobacterium terricola]